jgi:hypothetical protein
VTLEAEVEMDQLEITPEVERLATRAAAEPAALAELLAAVGPSAVPHPVREGAAAALKLVATRRPEAVLARWDDLMSLLDCDNAFSRMAAVHIVANLAPGDSGGRIGSALDDFYDHLGDMVGVAGHVLTVSPQIVRGRPELRDRITARILGLERIARPARVELLRSYAIEALDAYLEPAERTPAVVAFVAAGLAGDSPKTRKLAAAKLREWGVDQARG